MTLQNPKGGITIRNKLPSPPTFLPYSPLFPLFLRLSAITIPTQHKHTMYTQLMYMLCSWYVYGMFVSKGKDRQETRKEILTLNSSHEKKKREQIPQFFFQNPPGHLFLLFHGLHGYSQFIGDLLGRVTLYCSRKHVSASRG